MNTALSFRSWIVSLICLAGTFVLPQVFAADVVVQLYETTTVGSTIVLLKDVAKVTCTDAKEKLRAEMLEVQQLADTNAAVSVSAVSIKSRLIFAGWCLENISVTGANSIELTYLEPRFVTDADVEIEAHRAMCKISGMEEKELTVQLQQGFMQMVPDKMKERDGLRVQVNPPRQGLGSVIMQVQLWSGKEMLTSRPATFEVRKRHRVAIARVSLSREIALDDRSIQFENRFLSTPADELAPEMILGRNVRGSVAAGSILQLRDLQATASGMKVAIRKGESVQVIARAGSLRTRLRNAEAMQDGGLGESIELRNRETGYRITGKIIAPGQVIVQIR